MTARVTIGMPTFNNAATLKRALDSVVSQNYQDWVLVLTDDQSSDATFAIATEFAANDDRITVSQNPVRRVFQNFQSALSTAQTPYFVWLAGDDYWDPAFLDTTVNALDAAPAAVSAIPNAAFITDPQRAIPNLDFLRGTKAERIKRYLAHPGGTRMYGLMRTPVAQSAFPKRAGHAYDWYFMVSILSKGPQLSIPERLLFREETDWIAYAQAGKRNRRWSMFKRWPILGMSWSLVRDRKLPMRAVPALAGLNLRKHEEYVAVNEPLRFRRRQAMYRKLGLPIANRTDKLDALATFHESSGVAIKAPSRPVTGAIVGRADADVTAVVTCRNGEKILPAYLAHCRTLGHRVVLIDHGSTDTTVDIARSQMDQTVQDIIETPFDVSFDLTAQLELKKDVFSTLSTDWVIHADVDEFLVPPDGKTLSDLTRNDAAIAVACTEYLYVPRQEEELHDPAHFQKTMQNPFVMQERDEKQRLFRKDAPLDIWLETGGHTVTHRAHRIAPDRLRLNHYLGLSLDDIRSQYYARVFAPRDVFKLWHGNRMAAQQFEIHGTLEGGAGAVDTLPIFRKIDAPLPDQIENADIVVLGHSQAELSEISQKLAEISPEIRPDLTTNWSIPKTDRPILNCISHPALIHDGVHTRNDERQQAVTWTRRLANARGAALERRTPYAEIRIEDIRSGKADLKACLQGLLLNGAGHKQPVFLKKPDPVTMARYTSPVRTITQQLAAELNYR